MKVGIITFHWGTNYGGVLQAYALQQVVKKMGHQVQIINYAPFSHRDSVLYCFKTRHPRKALSQLVENLKEKKFILFREKYLSLTKRYYSLSDLESDLPLMDVYISGSDQVWNPYIALTTGLPYFLTFTSDSSRRIAYSVSLGCDDYPRDIMKIIAPYIDRFHLVSVREYTALSILANAGLKNVVIMPDPTLLLNREEVNQLILKSNIGTGFYFFYILQENQVLIQQLHRFVNRKLKTRIINTKHYRNSMFGIEKWLLCIKNARFIVTNSFHGVIFSILFEKQFVVVPVEGNMKGMNDRIYTLMKMFNLSNRILQKYDEYEFERLLNSPINWDEINEIHKNLQTAAISFLNTYL